MTRDPIITALAFWAVTLTLTAGFAILLIAA